MPWQRCQFHLQQNAQAYVPRRGRQEHPFHLHLPAARQRRMCTGNAIERVNQGFKRRPRVASLFPNEASLLRLVAALLCEISDEWATGKIYLNMNPAAPSQT